MNPLDDQQKLAKRVLRHWINGYGGQYNRDRKEALELVSVVPTLEEAIDGIKEIEGEAPVLIATDATTQEDRAISYEKAKETIQENKVVALIFGTAWGLHKEVIRRADRVLAPVSGKRGYNHLSVRAAAAIILDRLAGGVGT